MKKGSSENHNIFLVHDGSGEIGIYSDLCSLIHDGINCWGLRYGQIIDYLPQIITVEELAGKYINEIRKIQPHGPYQLVGACIGGIIAYEVVSQLEQNGEQVELLSLMDSPAPNKVGNVSSFNLQAEKDLINYLFYDPDLAHEIEMITEINSIWGLVIERLEGKQDMLVKARNLIPTVLARMRQFSESDLAGFLYYLAISRTLNNAIAGYEPKRLIKAPVYFFEAQDDVISDSVSNLKQWNKCCEYPVNNIIVSADHFKMYMLPDICYLADLINQKVVDKKNY